MSKNSVSEMIEVEDSIKAQNKPHETSPSGEDKAILAACADRRKRPSTPSIATPKSASTSTNKTSSQNTSIYTFDDVLPSHNEHRSRNEDQGQDLRCIGSQFWNCDNTQSLPGLAQFRQRTKCSSQNDMKGTTEQYHAAQQDSNPMNRYLSEPASEQPALLYRPSTG